MAVEEGPLGLERPEEAFVDRVGGQRRRERQVPAGEPLREAEEIRNHLLLLAGEERPGAAEAGRYLVADEQDAVLPAGTRDALQVSRRVRDHPGGAHHQGLEDHRGDLVAPSVDHRFGGEGG